MLFLLLLSLCYSVSSFDLEKTINDFEDGNLVYGLSDRFMKIHKNGEEIVEKLAKEKNLELFDGLSEKNPLDDFGFGRITDEPSRTKRDTEPTFWVINRFCKRLDYCCCNNCDETDCDSDLPDSFDWSQHVTMPARKRNSSDDLVAGVIADYVELLYTINNYKNVELAAQQLTDCEERWQKNKWTGPVTCLLSQGGFELESDYTSDSSHSKCRFNQSKIAVNVDSCYQLNIERENCLKHILVKSGPVLVGLRKANWDFNVHILDRCNAVLDTYTPYILVGFGRDFDVDIWYLMSPEGKKFEIVRGVACQDIGMYTLTFKVW